MHMLRIRSNEGQLQITDYGVVEDPAPGAAPGAACPVAPAPGPAAVTVGPSPGAPPSVGGGGGAPVSRSAFIRSRAR